MFFGRHIGDMLFFFCLFFLFAFLIKFLDLFGKNSNRILNAGSLKLVYIPQRFVRTMSTAFSSRIIITFVDL